MVFQILAGKLMSRNFKFVLAAIFDFFAAFGFFGVLKQWLKLQRKIRSGKYVNEVGSIRTPPDHLSVKVRGHQGF